MSEGLKGPQLRRFQELCIMANDKQIEMMLAHTLKELKKRGLVLSMELVDDDDEVIKQWKPKKQ